MSFAGICRLIFGAISFLLVGPVWSARAEAASCPPASYADMQRELSEKGDFEIVFFASWCSSCVESLKSLASHRRLFIASFDEPEAAVQVAQKFGFLEFCRMDTDIASALGVKALPATRWMKRSN